MDLHAVTAKLLVFVAVLTLVAIAAKIISCGGAARVLGMKTRESIIIGVGMVPRGEVAMIVALIGLNQALITQSTYSALILVSLLSTVIPPVILRNWLFKKNPDSIEELPIDS